MNANIQQFHALLLKELKEAFRDKRAMLSDFSALMMACSACCLVKGEQYNEC